MAKRKLKKRRLQKKLAGRKENPSGINSEARQQSDNSFMLILREVGNRLSEIKNAKVVQIGSLTFREQIKTLVKEYFHILRPEFAVHKITTDKLDGFMQSLMQMANAYTSKISYRRTLENIRKSLLEMEITLEVTASDNLINANVQNIKVGQAIIENKRIIETLERIVPSAAASYQQALNDLQKPRLSYRGTVAELREVLREVLDYLAPDNEVKSAKNFKFENGMKQPTMKQKVHYILKNRNKSATSMEAPEVAALIVDEGIAKLVRATYSRGSRSTHSQGEGQTEASQIKRYLDTVLCELLEIN